MSVKKGRHRREESGEGSDDSFSNFGEEGAGDLACAVCSAGCLVMLQLGSPVSLAGLGLPLGADQISQGMLFQIAPSQQSSGSRRRSEHSEGYQYGPIRRSSFNAPVFPGSAITLNKLIQANNAGQF